MSELESILNYLETTAMEPHDDYTSEFSYKEQKLLWKYIKELQQENKKHKEAIVKLELLLEDLKLNKKKEIEEGKSYFNNDLFAIRVKEILNILKEVE